MAALTISKEEEQRLKGLGFLNNKGTDNFSARVITVNGKVTVAQHRCLADAAEKFGNGNLTFTTRLTVEVRKRRTDHRRNRSEGKTDRVL